MATYYFAVAFEPTDTVSDDGTHLDAQYGFGVDSGNGVITALGNSGSQGRQFETVQIPASTNNQTNRLVIAIFSNLIGVNQSQSSVRCAFRPAHDVLPSTGLPLAPVNTGDANQLLTGILFNDSEVTESVNVNNGTSYGLPNAFYSTQWTFAARNFMTGQRSGTSLHFELTIEMAVNNGSSSTYYKVDPEMQIDF
jgi:hypothetical protein